MNETVRILVVDNGGVLVTENGVFGDRRTRDFLAQCSRRFKVTCCIGASAIDPAATPHGVSFDAGAANLITVPIPHARLWTKIRSYCVRIPVLWRTIRQSHFLYAFFPGHLSLLCVAIARFLHTPYGIYLRGERGKDSFISRWVLRGSRFVIAHGETLATAARRYCDDVELAIPMCPLRPSSEEERPRSVRTEGPWTLLYVGRIERRKGSHDLLEAASILRARGIDFKLNLVGDVNPLEFPDAVQRAGHWIHFAGRIDDDARLREYYRQADLFCFPSHDEGFPRVLYEAMAFGVPLVTTPVGSIPGFLVDGRDCLFVNVGDPSHLADVVERALTNADLRSRLSECAAATLKPVLRRMTQEGHDEQLVRKALACVGKGDGVRRPRGARSRSHG